MRKEGTPTGPRQVTGFGPECVRLIEASPFKDRQDLYRAEGEPTAACDRVPVLLADHPENPASCSQAVPDQPSQFQAPGSVAGEPTTVTLSPLYTVHHQRFAVYLKVMPAQ